MSNKIDQSFIVITSIFNPTEAVKKFAGMAKHKLIVVGDKKTPSNWHHENVLFIPVDHYSSYNYSLSKILPYNHYCRKMLGYLHAMELGADVIIDTDDDNIPKEDWNFPKFEGKFEYVNTGDRFVNIYKPFTEMNIWPRGLPLNFLNSKTPLAIENEKDVEIGIWQGLADEDPDVDAIYRLTNNQPCYFENRDPFFLENSFIAPFNSQNTIFRKELFALLYLPTHVTFRFTDILRGLVAQPIMWLYGYKLGITKATVIQKRNLHDLYKDFVSEVPMYLNGEKVCDVVSSVISIDHNITTNLKAAYKALRNHNIVNDEELISLDAWLNDISNHLPNNSKNINKL